MMSTVCFILFVAFMLWMNTSKRIAWKDKSKLLTYMSVRQKQSRLVAIALFSVAIIMSIYTIGVACGIN